MFLLFEFGEWVGDATLLKCAKIVLVDRKKRYD